MPALTGRAAAIGAPSFEARRMAGDLLPSREVCIGNYGLNYSAILSCQLTFLLCRFKSQAACVPFRILILVPVIDETEKRELIILLETALSDGLLRPGKRRFRIAADFYPYAILAFPYCGASFFAASGIGGV